MKDLSFGLAVALNIISGLAASGGSEYIVATLFLSMAAICCSLLYVAIRLAETIETSGKATAAILISAIKEKQGKEG